MIYPVQLQFNDKEMRRLLRISEILSKVKPGHMPGMDCI